ERSAARCGPVGCSHCFSAADRHGGYLRRQPGTPGSDGYLRRGQGDVQCGGQKELPDAFRRADLLDTQYQYIPGPEMGKGTGDLWGGPLSDIEDGCCVGEGASG